MNAVSWFARILVTLCVACFAGKLVAKFPEETPLCSGVAAPCGWDQNGTPPGGQPPLGGIPVPGYCCVALEGKKGIATCQVEGEVVGYRPQPEGFYCGRLALIVNGMCDCPSNMQCGSIAAETGCVSSACETL